VPRQKIREEPIKKKIKVSKKSLKYILEGIKEARIFFSSGEKHHYEKWEKLEKSLKKKSSENYIVVLATK
jgi:hypothetical protein